MKILIVEDDNFFREFYASKLREVGYEIQTAQNGEEGLKLINSWQPDMVILDLIMPIKDGFQVLTDLSQNQITSRIPVIVFSTLGQEKDIEKAKTLGARDYINKSYFDFDNMMKTIKTYSPAV